MASSHSETNRTFLRHFEGEKSIGKGQLLSPPALLLCTYTQHDERRSSYVFERDAHHADGVKFKMAAKPIEIEREQSKYNSEINIKKAGLLYIEKKKKEKGTMAVSLSLSLYTRSISIELGRLSSIPSLTFW